jgi:hypothetical protein
MRLKFTIFSSTPIKNEFRFLTSIDSFARSKSDAKKIKTILLEFNEIQKNSNFIIS